MLSKKVRLPTRERAKLGPFGVGDCFANELWYNVLMSKVEQIQAQVSELSEEELARFRAWYAEFDAGAWDREIEHDVAAGRLDDAAEAALRAHALDTTQNL
jgi:hypothetical protein